LNFKQGSSLCSDIIFGTSTGEVTQFFQGRHEVVNQDAHDAPINCLVVSDKTHDIVCVITGSEDGFIKIWTETIKPMQTINMRYAVPEFEKRCKIKTAFGVQSLELYCCDTLQPRRLLIGLRCGELIEAHLTDQEGQG